MKSITIPNPYEIYLCGVSRLVKINQPIEGELGSIWTGMRFKPANNVFNIGKSYDPAKQFSKGALKVAEVMDNKLPPVIIMIRGRDLSLPIPITTADVRAFRNGHIIGEGSPNELTRVVIKEYSGRFEEVR